MGALGAYEDDRVKDYGKTATEAIHVKERELINELEAKKSLQKTEAKRVDTTSEIEAAYNRAKLAIMTAHKDATEKKVETIGEAVEREEKQETEEAAEEKKDEKDLNKDEKKKVTDVVVEKLDESAKELEAIGT